MGDGLRRAAASVLCAVLLLTVTLNSQSPQEAARPRLVVVLVIDQFRADYLDRFASQFGPGGFRRLLREGAYFRSAYYPYAGVETAPGHATLATGTTPNRHGIAGNQWYDQKLSRVVEAIEDKDSPIVGGSNALTPASPRNLMSDTLSDELRLATLGRSRVYGVALKDRAAILSTGHGGLGAYWFDQKQGGFVTSKYYRDALPGWVVEFNQQHPISPPLDEFIRGAESNQLTVDFARELIRREELGRQGATDFLFVGFSANDYAGHRWGPYSSGVERITGPNRHGRGQAAQRARHARREGKLLAGSQRGPWRGPHTPAGARSADGAFSGQEHRFQSPLRGGRGRADEALGRGTLADSQCRAGLRPGDAAALSGQR